MKKKLSAQKGSWAEELPAVLWAYRTTEKTSTGETPFALAFGAEAMEPAELTCLSIRAEAMSREDNDAKMARELDLLDERREVASRRVEAYQRRITRYYNGKVRPRKLAKGDLVVRKVTANTRNPNDGAFGPNWEGPYRVKADLRPRTFKLSSMHGKLIKHTRNTEHLKKYY